MKEIASVSLLKGFQTGTTITREKNKINNLNNFVKCYRIKATQKGIYR